MITPSDSKGTRQHPRISLSIKLHSPEFGAGIEVRLESFKDRWVATACDGRRTETGLGSVARSALFAAVHALAPSSARALLADPELFGISCRVLAS